MPVASMIEANAADGNLGKWNVRLFKSGYTSIESEGEKGNNNKRKDKS